MGTGEQDATQTTVEDEEISVEILARQLVRQVSRADRVKPQDADLGVGELLLEIVLDGARYLVVRAPRKPQSSPLLSPREQEIARMVAKGYANKTIASVLEISSWTVSSHLRRIFSKLGVGSRAAMVARLLEDRALTSGPDGGSSRDLRMEAPPSAFWRS